LAIFQHFSWIKNPKKRRSFNLLALNRVHKLVVIVSQLLFPFFSKTMRNRSVTVCMYVV
jgi:hypothetical protein